MTEPFTAPVQIPVTFRHIGANKTKVAIGINIKKTDVDESLVGSVFCGKRIHGRLLKPVDQSVLPDMREPEHGIDGIFDSGGYATKIDKYGMTLSMPSSEDNLMECYHLTGGEGFLVADKVENLGVDDNAPKRKPGRPRKNPAPDSVPSPQRIVQQADAADEYQSTEEDVRREMEAGEVIDAEFTVDQEPLEGDPAKLATRLKTLDITPGMMQSLEDAEITTVEHALRWLDGDRQVPGVGAKGRAKLAATLKAFMDGAPADELPPGEVVLAWGCPACNHRWPLDERETCPKCDATKPFYEVGHGDPNADSSGDIVLGVDYVTVQLPESCGELSIALAAAEAGDKSWRHGAEVREGATELLAVYPNINAARHRTRSDALQAAAESVYEYGSETWSGAPEVLESVAGTLRRFGYEVGVAS